MPDMLNSYIYTYIARAFSRLAIRCSCTMRKHSVNLRDCHGFPPTSGSFKTSTVLNTTSSITRGSEGQLGARSFGFLPAMGTHLDDSRNGPPPCKESPRSCVFSRELLLPLISCREMLGAPKLPRTHPNRKLQSTTLNPQP